MDKSIRDAQDSDSDIIAELIYSTESNPEDVWGGSNKEENLELIKYLIKNHDSRYSCRFAKVAEYKGEVAGVLVLIPYNKLGTSNIKTSVAILKRLKGIKQKFKFIISELKFITVKECDKGDLYIANIAVTEKAKGLHIGKLLMEHAETLAKRSKYSRCTLLAKDAYVAEFYKKIDYSLIYNKKVFGNEIIKMAKLI
ncbi:GNAT family N-acetyltransferase [Clostridium algidicarnis]|uniref:Acetyltransferase (GNAT) family protein n=2 Tax=Clostridium algidicarnis TaxID=37659 RepID=A0A2S6G054_9CLOT|nr:GNAT family N-acetyltransferase [Clostridium algidicarnis]MBB6630862.1 GNAT family N-acetyltransferase [Clostridium algidicarnis]MBB6696765.1 GNAT family N-acetyltransferase [Clostridium algidicarnis]MBU3219348.1 GNAT family N-acetyltransferase [Clostridium algidicarnis]MCB2286179.1 GNAT family N-acetyltransferase [Clostridium algidicarnis]PPK49217.1 acetyltransferase (GNAT) family protein [Clostridium algidicarnis DSM 15099]